MHVISEREAKSLLRHPSFCLNCDVWRPHAKRAGTLWIASGIVDGLGRATHLSIELIFRRSVQTRMTVYVFTVFAGGLYGRRRIYQLEVNQTSRPSKDRHKRSHEHFGNARLPGGGEWAHWSYKKVLRHFCSQTKIDFQPPPPDPMHSYRGDE